jgi:predicted PurR-regulated permease PerM
MAEEAAGPADPNSGVRMILAAGRRRAGSLSGFLVTLAAGIIVLAGMKAAAPVLNVVLFGLFFGVVLLPVYRWLAVRAGRTWLALATMVLVIGTALAALGLFLLYAAGRFTASFAAYRAGFQEQLAALLAPAGGGLATLAGSEWAITALAQLAVGVVGTVANAIVALFLVLFLFAEAPRLERGLRQVLGAEHPLVSRLGRFAEGMVTYFWVRTKLNLLTGLGVTVLALALGVDFAVLWGLLAFFVSYVPYIGLVLAAVPPVLLAFAEFGLGRAMVLGLGIVGWNALIENLIQPQMTGRELRLSPAFVFVMFFFWTWLLGPAGAFLSMPVTVGLILLLDSFEESRWLAEVLGLPEQGAAASAVDSDG